MMRINKKVVRFSSRAVLAAILGLLCVVALVGCGNHRRSYHAIAVSQPDLPDEYIGNLGICWPAEWGEAEKTAARRSILAHLNAWELEFGAPVAPVKLIILLSQHDVSGVEQGVILVAPGECFEFEALFNLLTHLFLDDPQELSSCWAKWNAIGEKIADDLRQLCQNEHPAPEPEPTPDPTPEPEPTPDPTPDPDSDITCDQLVELWMNRCRPGLLGWLKEHYGDLWHKHWWKHWQPTEVDCKELWKLLKKCKKHGQED